LYLFSSVKAFTQHSDIKTNYFLNVNFNVIEASYTDHLSAKITWRSTLRLLLLIELVFDIMILFTFPFSCPRSAINEALQLSMSSLVVYRIPVGQIVSG